MPQTFVCPVTVLSKKDIARKMDDRREEGLQQRIGEVRPTPLHFSNAYKKQSNEFVNPSFQSIARAVLKSIATTRASETVFQENALTD